MYLPITESIKREIQRYFPINSKIHGDVHVWRDIDMYKWKEDPGVWKQKKGIAEHFYHIHLGNHLVHTFNGRDSKAKVIKQFLQALYVKVANGDIHLSISDLVESREKEKEAKREQKYKDKKIVENIDDSTPEGKMTKELVSDLVGITDNIKTDEAVKVLKNETGKDASLSTTS